MVEVFKTNVRSADQANALVNEIHRVFISYKVNFDLTDCDKILRVQSSEEVNAYALIEMLRCFGFEASVLPDEILVAQ